MKKAIKKAVSVLLVAVMVFGAALLTGFDLPEFNLFSMKAAAEEAAISGSCGDNLTWSLDTASGELVISGTGEMRNYSVSMQNGTTVTGAPWGKYFLSIKSVTIDDGVTSIGERAFQNCTSLENITVPNSITSIGEVAFLGCTSLESVIIPGAVTTIETAAFLDCTSLKSITIPDAVTTIGMMAFYNCTSLESVTIPDSVENIERWVFFNCTSLTSITVGSANTAYAGNEDGVLFSKDKTELIQYPIGNTRTSYTIPDGVTSVEELAFYNCKSLKSITIPDNVKNIAQEAFALCSNLESVTIGRNSAIIINKRAFSSCTSLAVLTIPKSLTVIESDVFSDCDNINDVYYEGSKADWNNFRIGSNNGTLLTAKVHYNYKYNNAGATETPDNTPDYDASVVDTYLMPTPTQTKISYGDSIVLHIDPSKIPESGKVEWYASNNNFSYSVSSDGTTCIITPDRKGDTTFTAVIYDEDGNIVSADKQEMTSKAGFFDKIIAFFKKLFGLTKTIPESFGNIY